MANLLMYFYKANVTAKRFFNRLPKAHNGELKKLATDKLRGYGGAHRELMPDSLHDTSQNSNNTSELSHHPTRVRERLMITF